MKKEILVIGAFGYEKNQLDGQTVKSRSVVNLIKSRFGQHIDQIVFDTQTVYRNPILIFRLLFNFVKSERIVYLPASKSLTYLFPLLYVLSILFRKKIILICIGGFQIDYFEGNLPYKRRHPLQKYLSSKIYAFLPEVMSVYSYLKEKYDFKNLTYFPNFRVTSRRSVNKRSDEKCLKIVYMARINKKMGYDVIFNFSKYARLKGLEVQVDFYGQISSDDNDDFISKLKQNSENTDYKGFLFPEQIHETLSKYDLLVLPTRYYIEGIPGSIIDAYFSAIPVVATNWKNAKEIIEHGMTGYIVSFDNPQEEFNECLHKLYNDRELLYKMKQNAYTKSLDYSSEVAVEKLTKLLNGD